MSRVFALRVRLNPRQARTVAAWRYEDARLLLRAGRRQHANGATYLGGLALDCLLKARLLEKHPRLASTSPETLKGPDRDLWNLIYRGHDLESALAALPEVAHTLQSVSSTRLDVVLKSICSRWSVHVRYWPKRIDVSEAEAFLQQVGEVREWL
ncbi:MAG: hypothetical protein K2Q09_03555 [Phycisphaerales bacterium]|nr:hypothetical protein [Phycisphaerales bacterium]